MIPDRFRYSFLLYTRNLGMETRNVVNPFTKEQFEAHVDFGITDQEREAVRAIFDQNEIKLLELVADEGWATYGNGGSEFRCFDLNGTNVINSIHVELVASKVSNDFLTLIRALALKANLALTSDSSRSVRVLSRPTAVELKRWPDAEVFFSAEDIGNWLRNQIKGTRVWDEEENEDDGKVCFSE